MIQRGNKCPACGHWYRGIGAQSRADDKISICSDCGTKEALGIYSKALKRRLKSNRKIDLDSNQSNSSVCTDSRTNCGDISGTNSSRAGNRTGASILSTWRSRRREGNSTANV